MAAPADQPPRPPPAPRDRRPRPPQLDPTDYPAAAAPGESACPARMPSSHDHARPTDASKTPLGPELSITRSANWERSERLIWAAIRARASASDMPRDDRSRETATSKGTSTTITAS